MTTAINGLITTKGIEKSILAQQTQGSYLYISGFGVSSTPITLSTTAKINDLNLNNVYQGLISSSIKIADTMLEVRVAIPPNSIIPPSVISETAEIKDIYLFARSKEYFIQSADSSTDIITIPTELGDILSFDTLNNNVSAIVITKKDPIAPNISNVNFGQKYYIEKISNSQIKLYTDNTYTTTIDLTANISNNTYYSIQEEFLFSVSQTSPTTELYYTPTGTTYLRLPLQIANINSSIYVFQYTQAIEISDHNTDPNAHPNIQDALELSGIFVENSNRIFNYKGQFFIKVDNGFYQIHNSVTDKKVVYYNNTFNRFENAITDGTDKQNYIGIYNEDDNTIKLSGIINTGHSFNAGEQLYLSTTIAGNIVNTVTPIRIGTALPNGNIVLLQGSSSQLSSLFDVNFSSLQNGNSIEYNSSLNKWENKPKNTTVYDTISDLINTNSLTVKNNSLHYVKDYGLYLYSNSENAIYDNIHIVQPSDLIGRYLLIIPELNFLNLLIGDKIDFSLNQTLGNLKEIISKTIINKLQTFSENVLFLGTEQDRLEEGYINTVICKKIGTEREYADNIYTNNIYSYNITSLSDERIKENIKTINKEDATDIIDEIVKNNSIITYNFNNKSNNHIGMSSQKTLEALKSLNKTDNDIVTKINGNVDLLGINYNELIPLMMLYIFNLKQEILELKSKNKNKKSKD